MNFDLNRASLPLEHMHDAASLLSVGEGDFAPPPEVALWLDGVMQMLAARIDGVPAH